MKAVVLIRHLPTSWSEAGRLQGRRDTSILEPGEAEIESIRTNRARLSEVGPFRDVFVSTLSRSQETARAYGYERARVEPLMDELDFGPYEGRPRSELERRLGSLWFEDPASMCLGERLTDFEARVGAFFSARCRDDGSVVVFGHGAWIRALISFALRGNIRAMNTFAVPPNRLVRLDQNVRGAPSGAGYPGRGERKSRGWVG